MSLPNDKIISLIKMLFFGFGIDNKDQMIIYAQMLSEENLDLNVLTLVIKDLIKSWKPDFKTKVPTLAEILSNYKLIISTDFKFKLLNTPTKTKEEQKKEFDLWYDSVKNQFKDNFYFKSLGKEIKINETRTS